MARLDDDCAAAAAKTIVGMVGHLLRPEEACEFFCMAVAAVEACLIRRDELLARDWASRTRPSNN